MMLPQFTFTVLASAAVASGYKLNSREKALDTANCPSYTLINARGTGEPQGESSGFKIMNANVIERLPGGKRYNVEYPAALDQNSEPGTRDVIEYITTTLSTSPSECFILEGYSQGATVVVDALRSLTGASFDAVKGVFLVGSPRHKPGLECNVDIDGGDTTKNAKGIFANSSNGIPDNWVSKSLDVCHFGDGVCDREHGFGTTPQHFVYPNDQGVQDMGAAFVMEQLVSN